MPTPKHWLIKSEPSVYPWSQLERDGRTEWTGVRNFEARNNLRAMRAGDLCLYYHSNEDKAFVGVARVVGEAKPDPTAPGEDWACVDVAPLAPLARPVTLAQVKAAAELQDMQLLTRNRLSVAPVTPAHFERVLALAGTRLAGAAAAPVQAAAPAAGPAEAPAAGPAEAPARMPGKTPAKAPPRPPVKRAAKAHGEASAQASGKAPGTASGKAPGKAPAKASGKAAVKAAVKAAAKRPAPGRR
jgi:predicted RNA-binding protein with PUA-like domain